MLEDDDIFRHLPMASFTGRQLSHFLPSLAHEQTPVLLQRQQDIYETIETREQGLLVADTAANRKFKGHTIHLLCLLLLLLTSTLGKLTHMKVSLQ